MSCTPSIAEKRETGPDDALRAMLTVERNAEMVASDGTVLRADVFRPRGDGPYPTILVRTPYGKDSYEDDASLGFFRLVESGYIVVCQDVRGRHASEGQWESFVRFSTHDARDGYDAVEWAARLPGASGRVGTLGGSYDAFLQWRLAPLRPPSLVAMSAHSIPARYTDVEGPGTMRPGKRLRWWVTKMSAESRRRSGRPGFTTREEGERQWAAGGRERWLNFLPWLELPEEVFEDETAYMRQWLRQPHLDPWQLEDGIRQISVPNLEVCGWFDHCAGDMRTYQALAEHGATEAARRGSRLIVGPWSHAGCGNAQFGPIDFGPDATLDGPALFLRWFDHWLKSRENGVDAEDPVRIFVMGDGRWRSERSWPLRDAEDRILYVTSSGDANTPHGGGRLLWSVPPRDDVDQYVYDPHDPVPDQLGIDAVPGPTDQRPLESRRDILVYQTEPLTERFEVTGQPTVNLYASSSAPDTDYFVRLVDVEPSGLAREVSLGLVRARYRNGLDQPSLITPDEVTGYVVRMTPTSNAFLPGHRIRIDVTSSCFPSYDRNHNTAADQNEDGVLVAAVQRVFHGPSWATRIGLPWIPNGAR